MSPVRSLRLGTRGSALALIQAGIFAEKIRNLAPEYRGAESIEIVVIAASGDHNPASGNDHHLRDEGGKGLFTKELEEAILADRIDLAIHSMKDVPTWLPEGLVIGGVLPRGDAREAFISAKAKTLATLPKGATFGTSSLRRQAQVLALRPDLKIVPFRGNVDTRLKKMEEGRADATMLAACGLERMKMTAKIASLMMEEEVLPAAAQGIIGAEIRADDKELRALLARVTCPETEAAMRAERALLAALDGSCHTPIGALARHEGASLVLHGLVAHPEGTGVWKDRLEGAASEPEKLGYALGLQLRRVIPSGILPD